MYWVHDEKNRQDREDFVVMGHKVKRVDILPLHVIIAESTMITGKFNIELSMSV